MVTEDLVVDVSCEPLHKLRLKNEMVRAYWIELAPGESTQLHRHQNPYAGICVGDALIRNEISGVGVRESHVLDGDVIYTSGQMTHRIENIGEKSFRNLTVEVLRNAGHASSSLLRLRRERRELEIKVDERAMRIATLELKASERCDLIGNHFVIWLRGETSAATFSQRHALRRPGDFAWCCGVTTVESASGAKVAIVEIR